MCKFSLFELTRIEVCAGEGLKDMRVVKNGSKNEIGDKNRVAAQHKIKIMSYPEQTKEKESKHTATNEKK